MILFVLEEAGKDFCRRALAIAPRLPQAFESLGNVLRGREPL